MFMFDNSFLENLPVDSFEAGARICDSFFEFHEHFPGDAMRLKNFDQYVEALAFADAFIESHDVNLNVPTINYEGGNSLINMGKVVDFFSRWRNLVKTELTRRKTLRDFEHAKSRYASMFGKVVFYEFTTGDFDRVQALINELRDLITKSKAFEKGHKKRLLKRLENLQGELHKKMSNLDMLWGLIGDAGVVLGKFGEDAKPFVDRIGEILKIVCQTQAKAENLKETLPLRLLTGGDANSGRKNGNRGEEIVSQ